jgi:hypothetical protein
MSDRAATLIASPVLNGIDFVEILTDGQKSLRVHFFNTVEVSGTLAGDEPITITGGETIKRVKVRDPRWEHDSRLRPILDFDVDEPGDFSNYTLKIRSPKLDRFYDHVLFSFKARCESNIDCATPPHICPPPAGDVPPIDYLAKDFLSFRKALSDFSALRYPEWQERSEADFGVMFMEALCAVADDLSAIQDRVNAEATLETATQRRSVVRHARLVDYEPRPAISSRVVLQFDVSGDGTIPCGVSVAALGADGTRVDFETGDGLGDTRTFGVSAKRNRGANLKPYIWDDRDKCLKSGSTEVWIAETNLGFQPGQRMVLDTRAELDADPPLREAVTLTRVTPDVDTLLNVQLTHLEWSRDDALKADHDIGRTIIAGNLVPATQGRRAVERFRIPKPVLTAVEIATNRYAAARSAPGDGDTGSDPIQYLYTLGQAPLAWLASSDGESFLPEVAVAEGVAPKQSWSWRRRIIDADASELAYTIEAFRLRLIQHNSDGNVSDDYDGDGGETIRFGDGTFGAAPAEDAEFEVTYRVGDGARGNVATDSINSIAPGAPSLISAVTNPFPAHGGMEAETNERVRRLAPQAFRARQFRAVLSEDYSRAAETLPWVSKAGTGFRWTGSWLTVFTAADPHDVEEVSLERQSELVDLLNRYRLAGYESYALEPRYVSLDLQVRVCARPDAFRGDVETSVSEALSRETFFHPDHFTFGTALERSRLAAAIQEAAGVGGVLSIRFRRRGFSNAWSEMGDAVSVGRDEIVRVNNDPSRPERGSIRISVEGGK